MTDYRKEAVNHWTANPCGSGTYLDGLEYGSLAYLDAIARSRYETDSWMNRAIDWEMARGGKLLEIGHGMGTDLLRFAEHGAQVYGIDITQEHQDLARRNFDLHGVPCELKVCDASEIDYPSDFFDAVYSHGVLHHIPNIETCIDEAYRVLKPGGRFVMGVYHKFSAFHLFGKILLDGIVCRNIFRLGYAGLMATIEYGADGVTAKPLVRTYSMGQVRRMLRRFKTVDVTIHHFGRDHFGSQVFTKIFPVWLEPKMEKYLGWYVIAAAKK